MVLYRERLWLIQKVLVVDGEVVELLLNHAGEMTQAPIAEVQHFAPRRTIVRNLDGQRDLIFRSNLSRVRLAP